MREGNVQLNCQVYRRTKNKIMSQLNKHEKNTFHTTKKKQKTKECTINMIHEDHTSFSREFNSIPVIMCI